MLLLIDSSSPALLCFDLRERGMMLLSYGNLCSTPIEMSGVGAR